MEQGSQLLVIEPGEADRLRGECERPLEREAERAGSLADPTRLGIARMVALGEELCVADLASIVEKPVKLVSHHLRLLRTHGIVASRREGKMVIYSVTQGGAALLDVVLGESGESGPRLRAVG